MNRIALFVATSLIFTTACSNDGDNAEAGSATVSGTASTVSGGDGDTETEGESGTNSGSASGDGDGDTGDGDTGDGDTGDGDTGDGDTGDGDTGDGDTGDGDTGDGDTGDGDATSTSGDGDGDATSGDGDGDATSGDGDGDATSGDGDTGDGDTGDGDGDPGGDVCGDGVVTGTEECDDMGESATCNANCTTASCGDSVVNATAGETCDPGQETAVCDSDCTAVECGDSVINASAGETCDDGANNGDGSTDCTATCTITFCGDNYLGSSEGCDDGNAINGDGCSDTCISEQCGNNVIDQGEQCDDGVETANCDANCTLAVCGDGTVNATAGETCDTNGPSATCDVDCTPVECGDGVININAGETCDDGTDNGVVGVSDCLPDTCVTNTCGDGYQGTMEGCDDGTNTGVEGQSDCTPACQDNVCGDNFQGTMEACDDGNASNSDGCLNTCQESSCGDGFINLATEECEVGVGSETCEGLGFDAGTLECVGCFYDTTACTGGNSCFQTDIPALTPQNPNIMMVLDKSGSMFDESKLWDSDNNGTPDSTRWASLYDVSQTLFNTFETKVNFGVQLFPYAEAINQYACSVGGPEPDLGLHTTAELLADMPAANTVGGDPGSFGATPTREGLLSAYGSLAVTTLPGDKAVILITDGAANCSIGNDTAPLTADSFDIFDDTVDTEIANALTNDGIATYVVGIAISNSVVMDGVGGEPEGVNTYDVLNGYATAGGTGLAGGPPFFYNAQNQSELLADIQGVLNSLQSCFVDLPFPPLFPELTEVTIGGMLVTYIPGENSCAGFTSGWVYTDATYTQIELCGDSCVDLGGNGSLDVVFKCEGGG